MNFDDNGSRNEPDFAIQPKLVKPKPRRSYSGLMLDGDSEARNNNFIPKSKSKFNRPVELISEKSKSMKLSKLAKDDDRSESSFDKLPILDSRRDQSSLKGVKDIKQTAQKLVITKDNYNYQLPFLFTEKEISEAFNTLDIHQREYISEEEVKFFLDILGEEANESEINEMINMLDIQGTGKVYYEQFLKMAQGQSLSPIGIAYPPSIRYLNQRNLNKMSNKETLSDIRKFYNNEDNELEFIKDQSLGMESGFRKNKEIERRNNDFENQIDNKDFVGIIKKAMKGYGIDIMRCVRLTKKAKLRDIVECDFTFFGKIVSKTGQMDDELKQIFVEFSAPFSVIDLREFLVYCIARNGWSDREKCKVSFSLFDNEDSNKIFFEDIVNMLNWLNFDKIPKKANFKKLVTKIFEKNNMSVTQVVSKYEFNKMLSEYQSVWFSGKRME